MMTGDRAGWESIVLCLQRLQWRTLGHNSSHPNDFSLEPRAVITGQVAGESQGPVPRLEQHALQLQLAVTVYVGLVQPHGQVGQAEVAVGCMGQLCANGVFQQELLLVCVRQPAGDLIKEGCGPCVEQRGPVTFFPVMIIF